MIVRRWRLQMSGLKLVAGVLATSAVIASSGPILPAWAGVVVALGHGAPSALVNGQLQQMGYRGKRRSGDEEAAALFDAGQYELDSGFPAASIRIFTSLVSRYPDTVHAQKAQKILDRLKAQKPPRRARTGRARTERPREHSASELQRTKPNQSMSLAPIAPENADRTAARDEFEPDTRQQLKLMHAVGDRVFFAPNSVALGAKAGSALRRQATWLQRNGEALVEVVGYADEPGSSDLNMRISRQRAEAVQQRLIAEGVDSARIRILALGQSQPVATCRTARCSAQNRRVITRLLRIKAVRSSQRRSSVPRGSRR